MFHMIHPHNLAAPGATKGQQESGQDGYYNKEWTYMDLVDGALYEFMEITVGKFWLLPSTRHHAKHQSAPLAQKLHSDKRGT